MELEGSRLMLARQIVCNGPARPLSVEKRARPSNDNRMKRWHLVNVVGAVGERYVMLLLAISRYCLHQKACSWRINRAA